MTWDTRRLMSLHAIWNQKYCERNARVWLFSHDVSLESNHVVSHLPFLTKFTFSTRYLQQQQT